MDGKKGVPGPLGYWRVINKAYLHAMESNGGNKLRCVPVLKELATLSIFSVIVFWCLLWSAGQADVKAM